MDDSHPTHPWFAALYDPLTGWVERLVFQRHRQQLVKDASGQILDIGSGTGVMFSHYETELDSSTATVHAVEPDPHMLRRAKRKATTRNIDIHLHQAGAESLPFTDDTFDTVVAALVFCTIGDRRQALSEIHRVLSPRGEFRFFEHVCDSGWRESVQTTLNPVWKRVVGGCHLDRDTPRLFRSDDRFEISEYECFRDGVVPVNPFVRGVMRPKTAL